MSVTGCFRECAICEGDEISLAGGVGCIPQRQAGIKQRGAGPATGDLTVVFHPPIQTVFREKEPCKWYNDMVNYLAAVGEDPNRLTEFGEAPLCMAAYRAQGLIVEALLQRPNIDVNIKGKHGRTPLYLAAEEGHVYIVKLLLRHPNIDVNCRNAPRGATALMAASRRGHSRIVELLLQHPTIMPDLTDSDGSSALHHARTSSVRWKLHNHTNRSRSLENVIPRVGPNLCHSVTNTSSSSSSMDSLGETNRFERREMSIESAESIVVDNRGDDDLAANDSGCASADKAEDAKDNSSSSAESIIQADTSSASEDKEESETEDKELGGQMKAGGRTTRAASCQYPIADGGLKIGGGSEPLLLPATNSTETTPAGEAAVTLPAAVLPSVSSSPLVVEAKETHKQRQSTCGRRKRINSSGCTEISTNVGGTSTAAAGSGNWRQQARHRARALSASETPVILGRRQRTSKNYFFGSLSSSAFPASVSKSGTNQNPGLLSTNQSKASPSHQQPSPTSPSARSPRSALARARNMFSFGEAFSPAHEK